MVSTETQSILRRKAALGTQQQVARAMSVAKAMRQSIAKLGKELFEMPLSAIGAVTEERQLSDLSEIVSDSALLCLLEGEDGRIGAAIIGADIVGGLIQQQTMGHVSAAKGASRPMTQTDAAMCAPLLDSLFERVAPMLELEAEHGVIAGYRFGARFEDARALDMALDMPEYFVVRLTLDLAGGTRQGEMSLILPMIPPANASGPDALSKTDENGASCTQMNDVAMGLPTELNMVLCKLSLKLAQVKRLAVGEVLRLPHNTFPETDIVTQTGKIIGSGVLGQVNGMRALRLKRVPIHATQPRRRESDLVELDLPEITALPRQNNGAAAGAVKTEIESFTADLPAPKNASADTKSKADELSISDADLSKLENGSFQDIELPELDDFPDLAELSQAG